MKFKKLSINRETVRNLSDRELGAAVGGKAPDIYLPTGDLQTTIGFCGTCDWCGGENTASTCVPYTQLCVSSVCG